MTACLDWAVSTDQLSELVAAATAGPHGRTVPQRPRELMTPAERADLVFSIKLARGSVASGTWREVYQGKPTVADLTETGATEKILDHFLRSDWSIEKLPPSGRLGCCHS